VLLKGIFHRDRGHDLDVELEQARRQLADFVEAEAEARAAELQRTLAIARSQSVALLAEEERRLVEERRIDFTARERSAANDLTGRLLDIQRRTEQQVADWQLDLERVRASISDQLVRLEQRQTQLIAEVEGRIAAEAERLRSEVEEEHKVVTRLRGDLQRTIKDAIEVATAELETHASDRRRELQQLAERIQRREQQLKEQMEREETEAARRLTTTFADVERRQIEQFERVVGREAGRFAEAAALEFEKAIRAAREEAARRLARELDRAVENFTREAERVLAERLSGMGDTGGQRLEKRVLQSVEKRLAETEALVRDRLGTR
jgi:hypothetical protein